MRPRCALCLRPQVTCICSLKTPVVSPVEVLILQHAKEVFEIKGTARLLHLCLPNSSLVVSQNIAHQKMGDLFDESLFHSSKNSVLLYPVTPEDHSLGIQAPPALNPELLSSLSNIRLIVLDGTWRKSRKILINNPYLQRLPRLALRDLPAGQYTIRKARKPHQLSTLEATCAALAQLESNSLKFDPILQSFAAFNAFVGQQMKLNVTK